MGLAILVLFAFLHYVRPCASWLLQFMKECSNCVVKMTVLAHCHGGPFCFGNTHIHGSYGLLNYRAIPKSFITQGIFNEALRG